MSVLLFIVPTLVSALIAYALTPLAHRLSEAVGAMDQPGGRKLHTVAMPRLGGVAVLSATGLVIAAIIVIGPPKTHILPPQFLLAVVAAMIPIAAISFLDDIKPQRSVTKFSVHLAAASLAVALGVRLNDVIHLFGQQIHIGWLAIPISILWLAGITNAFNLVDGLDGLSAGLALISAISLTAVSIVTRRYEMAGTAAILAGALIGFLPYNLYPAKIYLGDTGATGIGFLLGALTLRGGSTTTAGLAVSLPIVVLGLPLADTFVSMLRRAIRGKAGASGGIFGADRNHIHHRLLAIGLDHKRAVLTLYSVGVALAICAFGSVFMKTHEVAWLLAGLAAAAIIGLAKLGYDEFALFKKGIVLRLYDAPVLRKGVFVVFFDLVVIAFALYATTVLKYDDWGVRRYRHVLFELAALLPPVTILTFAVFRIYRRAWSAAGLEDIIRSSAAVLTSSALALFIAKVTLDAPPRVTFMATYTMVMLVMINGARASYRVFQHWNVASNTDGDPVVIYGAGKGGVLALREILTNTAVAMHPVGFIDDNPLMRGRFINGYPVLGSLDELADIVLTGKARGVVVASEKIPIAKVLSAKDVCNARGAWMRVFRVDFRHVSGDAPARFSATTRLD